MRHTPPKARVSVWRLTKELVDLHHGTITAESTPGKGSVFTVTFPIEKSAYAPNEITESVPQIEKQEQPRPEVPRRSPGPSRSTPPADGKPIVLVVEDNADLRAYIREFLEADYAVQEAGNGKEGYDRALEIVPDLVISDVMMPEMDGMELCRALKQDVRTSHVPVILLTARAGTDSKIEGLEIGADDYVTKPFDSKELVARVRNLIEQRRQLRKKFSAGVVLKPGEVAVSSLDDALLKKVMEAVEKNIGNEDFGVDDLAREAFLSRTHLNRKLHALTNLARRVHTVHPAPARPGAARKERRLSCRNRLSGRIRKPLSLQRLFPRAVRCSTLGDPLPGLGPPSQIVGWRMNLLTMPH